ncbi:hypothetical protein vseg_017765 [Gypsophila vaccaria]
MLFKPMIKTKDQIYQAVPKGRPRDSWIHLVDYWYSEKGKKFYDCGKEARSTQTHMHITGSTSYANIRAAFVIFFSILSIYIKDDTFVKGTVTEDL